MLGPQDLTRLAQVIDPSLEKIEFDVAHLDYSYVASCTNVKELQMLLQVLKSGDEGYYPELEVCIVNRIATLENIVPVNVNEVRTSVVSDLNQWVASISQTEKRLVEDHTEPTFPRVRNSPVDPGTLRMDPVNSRRKDHSAWDKVDIEHELLKVDTAPLVIKPPAAPPIAKSQVERERLALTEKLKGNESFKSGDYEEAVSFYKKSISLFPTAVVFCNLALGYLKLENFSQARISASQSLEMEPSLKAYLRRAQALFNLALYQDCITDCNKCLEMDNCLEAKALKEKAIQKNVKVNGKKLEIVEDVEEIYTEASAAYNIPLVNDSDDDF